MKEQQVQQLIRSIVLRESELYDLVYFYGDKDRILFVLSQIENDYKMRYPAAKVIRMDAETFRNRKVWEGSLLAPERECDLFIFENIEKLAGLETGEQQIYEILDWLLENRRQIIVTGSVPVASIDRLASRICAQLDGGVSFHMVSSLPK